jgi:hypothetical protein
MGNDYDIVIETVQGNLSAGMPTVTRHPLPLAHFVAIPQRNSAIAHAQATGCYSLQQIAQASDLHYATISRIVNTAETGQWHLEQEKTL